MDKLYQTTCNYKTDILEYDDYSLNQYPTNIDLSYINFCKTSKCNLVNLYNDEYSTNVSYETNHMEISPTNMSDEQYIKFNDAKYNINKILISKNPFHFINGENSDTLSIILKCVNVELSTKKLMIEIPLTKSPDGGNKEIEINLKNYLDEIYLNFNNNLETVTSVTIDEKLNIKKIFPDEKFYFYNSTYNNQDTDVIVFSPTASHHIYFKVVEEIQTLLECSNNKTVYLKQRNQDGFLPIYYSNKKPQLNETVGDDIYIDCKPTELIEPDKSEELFMSKFLDDLGASFSGLLSRVGLTGSSGNAIMRNVLEFLMVAIFAIIILGLIYAFPKYIGGKLDKIELPNFSQQNSENNNKNSNGNGQSSRQNESRQNEHFVKT